MATTQSEIYHKYINGCKLTDNELKTAVPFWKKLSEDLFDCGPVFRLSANEAQHFYRAIEAFSNARQLECNNDQYQQDVNWRNTFDASRMGVTHITKAQEAANHAKYPYFCWNNRVFATETGEILPARENILTR